jgi:predicted dehydrogenase
LPAIAEIDVVGVSSGSESELVADLHDRVCERHPDAQRYDDPVSLLNADLDLVVACRFGDLADWTVRVLDRNCRVYTEKPVVTALGDLNRVCDAYDESGGELAAMLGLRYESGFLTAHERVADGAIGDIRLLNARKSYVLGQRDEFYRSRERHGGLIPWVGIHAVDWIHWFCDRPVSSIEETGTRRLPRGERRSDPPGSNNRQIPGVRRGLRRPGSSHPERTR